MGSTSRWLGAVAEALLLGALALAPWPYGAAPDWARYALCTLVGCALSLWALARVLKREPLPPLWRPALLLPVVALAQLTSARSVAPVWTAEALLLLLAFLGASVFWSERARDHRAALRLAGVVLLTCVAQGVFGAIQWHEGANRIYGNVAEVVTTPFGSYVDHNHFAGLVSLGTLLAAGLTLGHAHRRGLTPVTVALGGLTLAQGATLLASRSRGGLLALVAGLTLLALLQALTVHHKQHGSRARSLAVPILALGVLAFGLVVVPAQTRAHLMTVLVGGGDSSSAYRRDVALDTWRLALSRPFMGSGLGAFADAFPPFKRAHGEVRTTHAESDVLELLAEAGLAGLGACAWLSWYVGRRAWERLRDAHSGLRKGLVLGAAAALGALAVHSLFDFNLRLPANALMASMLLGLLAVPRTPPMQRCVLWPGVALACLCVCMTLAAGWRTLGARALERAQRHPQPLLRIAELDETVRLHPYLDQAWYQRGVTQRALAGPTSDLRERRLRTAEQDLTRALQLRPQWAVPWAELGWTRLLRGDGAGALNDVTRARELDPTQLGIGFARAHVLRWNGDVPGAIAELGRVVKQHPDWWSRALADALTFTREPALLGPLAAGDDVHERALAAALEQPARP